MLKIQTLMAVAILGTTVLPATAFSDGYGPPSVTRGNLPPGHGPLPPPPGYGPGYPPGNPGGVRGPGAPGGPYVPPPPPGYGPGNGPGYPPGNPGGVRFRPIVTPPGRPGDMDDQQAAQVIAQSIAGLGCDRAGDALRNLSNQILSNSQFVSNPLPPPRPGDSMTRGEMMRRRQALMLASMRSPAFWESVWTRLADIFKSCNINCFSDGVAIGQISGAGYCAAATGVGGLDAPGFLAQGALPVCGNATFAGCQNGYQNAVAAFNGCSAYTTGSYDATFKQFESQDCHLDQSP